MTSAGAEFSGHDGFSPRFRSMIWNNNKGVWGGKRCKAVSHSCTCLEKRLCLILSWQLSQMRYTDFKSL